MKNQAKQRSAEWFESRKGRVTGSVAGAILGLNPWATPEDILRRMVRDYHGAPSEFTGNIATEYGQLHEGDAIFELELELGEKVVDCGFFIHPDHCWLGASPDGLVVDDAVAEVKAPFGRRDKVDFAPLSEQPHYHAQVQIEMYCTGRKRCYFFQWSPIGTSLEIIPFNQEWIDEAMPRLKAFHNLYLSELDNPDHLEPLRVNLASMEAVNLANEYDELSDAIDRATDRKKEILERLVKISGERNAEVEGRKLTKVKRAGSISYAKAVKDLMPDADLSKYRGKPSEYWQLG